MTTLLALVLISAGTTPPGTLITLRAYATYEDAAGNVYTSPPAECMFVVGSAAQYPRTVYVCPRQVWHAGQGSQIIGVDPAANGWQIKRLLSYGAGCPAEVVGAQTTDGALLTEHGLVN